MLQPMCWTRSRTTRSHVPKNARAILPDTRNVPLNLSCVTIARLDFMIGFHLFTDLIIHTFDSLKFEIKTFIQPFANFIKRCALLGALVRDLRRSCT